jgi:hypothetical protein
VTSTPFKVSPDHAAPARIRLNFNRIPATMCRADGVPGFRASLRCGEGQGTEGARTPGDNCRSRCALQGFADARGMSSFDATGLRLHRAMPMNTSHTKPSERAARPAIVARGARALSALVFATTQAGAKPRHITGTAPLGVKGPEIQTDPSEVTGLVRLCKGCR